MLVMIAIATGFSIDPPTAWIMRKTTKVVRLGAKLHNSEPAEKTVSPNMNVRLRPSRSAVEPDSISRLASTSV